MSNLEEMKKAIQARKMAALAAKAEQESPVIVDSPAPTNDNNKVVDSVNSVNVAVSNSNPTPVSRSVSSISASPRLQAQAKSSVRVEPPSRTIATKLERLCQRVSELQNFANEKYEQDGSYKYIADQLNKTIESLKEGRLIAHLVAKENNYAQALRNCLASDPGVNSYYAFKVVNFPEDTTETSSTANLMLQTPGAIISSNAQFKLSTEKPTKIGRDSNRSNIVIVDSISMVSGLHITIQANNNNWSLVDSSSNGTYINGNRIKGNYLLQSGDRISLGGSPGSNGIAEFIFENKPELLTPSEKTSREFSDCDMFCIVTNPKDIHSNELKPLLKKVSSYPISKILIVCDVDSDKVESINHFGNMLIDSASEWLASNKVSVDFVAIQLRHFFYSTKPEITDNKLTEELKKLYLVAESLTDYKPEDTISRRVSANLSFYISVIEKILNNQDETLKKELQQLQERISGMAVEDYKAQFKNVIKQIADDRERFFRQTKTEITQSKISVLDTYNKKSVMSRIQVIVEEFIPRIISRSGNTYLTLGEANSNEQVDLKLFRFCAQELCNWGVEEWQRVLNKHFGGLKDLFQRTKRSLTALSIQMPSEIDINKVAAPKIDKCFQDSVMGASQEVAFREDSVGSFLFKNIRSTIMTVGVFGTLIVTGSTLLSSNNDTGKSASASQQKGQLLKNIKESIPGFEYVAVLLIAGLIGFIIYDFVRTKHLKRSEAGEKLKKDMISYYQSYVKDRSDKVIQEILITLEIEEQRLKNVLDRASEQVESFVSDFKRQVDDIKNRQSLIGKEKTNLDKLKRAI